MIWQISKKETMEGIVLGQIVRISEGLKCTMEKILKKEI